MSYYIALGIEYAGTNFRGSQRQKSDRTVQSELEQALSSVANEEIHIELAGRTDSGVHAMHQVVAFQTTASRPKSAWIRGTNTHIPNRDLAVHSCESVEEQFDPRRSASWRRYVYIYDDGEIMPAIGRGMVSWSPKRLDHVAMHTQAEDLIGEHDFSSFRASDCQSKSPNRCVHYLAVHRIGRYVVMDIVANAFLFRMVRNIAGTLATASTQRYPSVAEVLKARDRAKAPPTAPPEGLYLVQIAYDKYPSLGAFRIPPVLSAQCDLQTFQTSDFPDIRSTL